MMLQRLYKQGLLTAPKWLPDNSLYLTMMGSVAYGVSGDTSDVDVYGFCMPPKHVVFPHINGHIEGFGAPPEKFEVWQQHHVKTPDGAKEYDFSIYSIVRYFDLCRENNPNMIDSLFTAPRCVLHNTPLATHVRANRKLFLHKGAFHKFRGYAYAQLSKIKNKTNSSNPKRAADIERHGFDTKFAYHVARLALECRQILETGDLDLERDRELLKAIRRGDWTLEKLDEWFKEEERQLGVAYTESKLPHKADLKAIRALLLECLEMHYGDLSTAVNRDPSVEAMLNDLRAVIDRYEPATRAVRVVALNPDDSE